MSDDLDRAAVALAALSVTDRTAALRGPDLLAAAAARDSVLSSARRLLAGVTPQANGWSPLLDPLTQLERRPAVVLRQLLTRRPLLRADAAGLSDALAHPATTPAVRQWQTAARHLFLAEHAWTGVQVTTVPAATAWGITAMAAGTALAVDRLDGQLARAYRADGQPDIADRLGPSRPTGLAVAAREVLATAATGPLDTTWTPPPADPGHVHPVLGPDDLAAGATRYRELVAAAPTLSPAAVYELAQGQRIVLDHVARLLRQTQPHTAAAVEGHTRDLAAIPADRRVATILPSDPRPARQLSQLAQQISHLQPHHLTDRAVQASVRAAAAAIAAAAPALAATAARQQKSGRWLVPAEGTATPQWRRIDNLDRLPTVDALTATRPGAERVIAALTTAPPATAPASSRSRAVDMLITAAANRQPTRTSSPDQSVSDTPSTVLAARRGGATAGASNRWAENAADLALRWHPPAGRQPASPSVPGGGPNPPPPPAPVRRPPR